MRGLKDLTHAMLTNSINRNPASTLIAVRFGSKADDLRPPRHVCFTPLSGRMLTRVSTSALGQTRKPVRPPSTAARLCREKQMSHSRGNWPHTPISRICASGHCVKG